MSDRPWEVVRDAGTPELCQDWLICGATQASHRMDVLSGSLLPALCSSLLLALSCAAVLPAQTLSCHEIA